MGATVRATTRGRSHRTRELAVRQSHRANRRAGQGPFRVAERSLAAPTNTVSRSEERRVGEESRSRWSPYHLKKTWISEKWGLLGATDTPARTNSCVVQQGN